MPAHSPRHEPACGRLFAVRRRCAQWRVGDARRRGRGFSGDTRAGGADYGEELDLQILWPITNEWTLALKYADYMSDGFAQDTRKFWVWLELAI